MTHWTYEIRVVGDVDPHALQQVEAEFDDVQTLAELPGTLLICSVPDQAAVLGLLDEIHGLGLHIQSAQALPDVPSTDDRRWFE